MVTPPSLRTEIDKGEKNMNKFGIFLMAAGFLIAMVGVFTEGIPVIITACVFVAVGGILWIVNHFSHETRGWNIKGKGYAVGCYIGFILLLAGLIGVKEFDPGVLLFAVLGAILLAVLLIYKKSLDQGKSKSDDDDAEKW